MNKENIESAYTEAAKAFDEASDYYRQGKFDFALSLVTSVIGMYKLLHESVEPIPKQLGLSYRLQGECYLGLKEYEKSKESFNLALSVFEASGDLVDVMIEKSNLSRVEKSKIIDAK